ncbi:MAG: GNAT family N-acetyltransferase [Candidatus Thorarchaeota archaeon]
MVCSIYNYAEIAVRRAELSEVDDIKKIIKEAYAPVKKQLSRTPGALEEGLDKISRHIQMGNQYIALLGTIIVGTMRVSLSGNAGVVSRLAVRTEYRKRRIGTVLIEYAENLLTHMNALLIEVELYGVLEGQTEFYTKHGYVETDRQKRSGEVIVTMQKSLEEQPVVEDEDL